MTPIEQARIEHEQAKRRLRRLQEQARYEFTGWRVLERCNAQERVAATLARLERLEADATQPDGAGSRQTN